MTHLLRGLCCLLVLTMTVATNAKDDSAKIDSKAKQKELRAAFTKKMKNIDLVGKFTIDGREDNAKEERYEIKSAKHVKGDNWLITARIKYGKTDLEVPVNIKVLWAGDTPVLTMTDAKIPLLGTFTTRVMIYGNRYAGTWQHGQVGGLMYGHIESRMIEKEKTK